jgi:phosphopantetheinyl transferase
MPQVYQQNVNAFTRLGVWHINEAEQYFLDRVPLHNNIKHPHKRLQHLAGRILLKELFDDFPLELICIADTRKPFLPAETYHFSLSHCGDYAAAIVSRHNRVGVDIEIPQKKIESISTKFLKQEEMGILRALPIKLEQGYTLAWSIKETIFKWYGDGKVDFKEHIKIINCTIDDNQFSANCYFLKGHQISLKVNGIFFNGNCLTWTVSET